MCDLHEYVESLRLAEAEREFAARMDALPRPVEPSRFETKSLTPCELTGDPS